MPSSNSSTNPFFIPPSNSQGNLHHIAESLRTFSNEVNQYAQTSQPIHVAPVIQAIDKLRDDINKRFDSFERNVFARLDAMGATDPRPRQDLFHQMRPPNIPPSIMGPNGHLNGPSHTTSTPSQLFASPSQHQQHHPQQTQTANPNSLDHTMTDAPIQQQTPPTTNTEAIAAAAAAAAVAAATQNGRSTSPIPTFDFKRDITTVEEVWREWHDGIEGSPSIKSLDTKYGPKWRKEGRIQQWHFRRKVLIHEIENRTGPDGNPWPAIMELEMQRQTEHKTLNGLIKGILEKKAERKQSLSSAS